MLNLFTLIRPPCILLQGRGKMTVGVTQRQYHSLDYSIGQLANELAIETDVV